MSKSPMKVILAGLLGAILALVTPVSAKFIGTMYYIPSEMLQLCRSDIARGQAGFCTGYVLGTIDNADTFKFGICFPNNIEYEDMLRAVVRRFEEGSTWMKSGDTPLQVKVALKNAWPCKQ
jgi:Rap1a immunity proteins